MVLGISTFVSLAVTIIKRKFMAVHLGPDGFGIYAQVFNFFNVAGIIASLGLSQGITTFIAKNNDEKNEISAILKSAMSVLLAIALVLIILTVLFLKPISLLILNNGLMSWFLLIAILAVPFQILGQALLSFLQGIKNIRNITLSNVTISISGLIITVPLIIVFSTNGAVISILVLAALTFFIYLYYCKGAFKAETIFGMFNFIKTFKSRYFRKLMEFGSLRFVQVLLSWFTFFIMRTIILKKLGAESNGIYEAAYTFSLLFLPFIANLLWSYSYPEYCKAGDNKALSTAINRFLRLSLTITFPAAVICTLIRPILIEKIIFTDQFSAAVQIMPIRLLVDMLTVIAWSFNVVLLAKERLKVAIKFELLKDCLFLSCIIFITSSYKLKGILITDAVVSLVPLVLSYLYIKKEFDFKLLEKNMRLIVYSVVLFVIIALFPVKSISFICLGGFILILWFLNFVSFAEIKQIFSFLKLNRKIAKTI